MFLILPHNEAKQRNIKAGKDIGLKGTEGGTTMYRWKMEPLNAESTYLNVLDGDGLTEEELAACVDELPAE